MSKQLVLATKNRGKIIELQHLLQDFGIEVKGFDSFPQFPEVVEDGETFEANALKKAQVISDFLKLPALADDSGLEVDALEGRPGVYSARFAGPNATDEENVDKLIESVRDVPGEGRSARFRCVLALVVPGKKPWTCDGVCEGAIILERKGSNGFGYDPVFFLPDIGKTMAELSKEEKSQISHRGKAFRKLKDHIGELL